MPAIALLLGLLITAQVETARADVVKIPYSRITAPVVHAGRWHVLTVGTTSVVLDGDHGMSIAGLYRRSKPDGFINTDTTLTGEGAVTMTLGGSRGAVTIDQRFDGDARLVVIDQGKGRVAARSVFTLMNEAGIPFGSGTIDIYVYDGSVFLAPSCFIDSRDTIDRITHAGIGLGLTNGFTELIVKGLKVIPTGETRRFPFGGADEGFEVILADPGRAAVKIGWTRNTPPSWLYMRNTAQNPETDELYEKWPHWLTQRGPVTWIPAPGSGFSATFDGATVSRAEFNWAKGDSIGIPKGGYKALNGMMALFLSDAANDAQNHWVAHKKPVKPIVRKGTFKYYNEIEGIYEIDTAGGDVEAIFDNQSQTSERLIVARLWNLTGGYGYSATVDRRAVPVTLLNDGDIIDDPMVPFVKTASGPARTAIVSFTVKKGGVSRLSFTKKPGIQFVYQMYSSLETLEAWNGECTDNPLFSLHLTRAAIYNATLPGRDGYAMAKLPVFWLKNGVNNDTFMNHVRGFTLIENGPDSLKFRYEGVDLLGTGLSRFTVTVPYRPEFITFSVNAHFEPLGDFDRWTSVEYCDLYPFEHVYRRGFHYDDVYFLTGDGVFDQVGTGAWGGGFKTVDEPERLGYYAESESREGPGRRTPDRSDGSVWILGDNPLHGNILFRRGEWKLSVGATSVFSLCNAWVDIHNTITGRTDMSAHEDVTYTVEIFPGRIPSVERLTELYRAAVGDSVRIVDGVQYDDSGAISGFVVK